MKVQLQLRDLQLVTMQSHLQMVDAFARQESITDSSTAPLLEAQKSQERHVVAMQAQLQEISKQLTQSTGKKRPLQESTESSLPSDSRMSSFDALQMRFLYRRPCREWCPCACHKKNQLKTPNFLHSVLGKLYIGYTAVPSLSPPCNINACRGRSQGFIQLSYFFPRWFLSRAVMMSALLHPTGGPEMCIRMVTVRNYSDPIFQYCYEGEVDSVRQLLVSGKASVLDVSDTTGHSPLHIAMICGQVEIIKLLLQFGAEQFMENAYYEYVAPSNLSIEM